MTIERAELLDLWPETHLRRVRPAVVAGLGLPGGAVRLLVEVGLPAHGDHYGFEPVPPRVFTSPGDVGRWCQIGRDEGGDFSVDLANGTLWSCVDVPDLPTRFVNTTLTAFLRSLCAATRVRRDHAGDVQGAYEALRARVDTIDPRAREDGDGYWAVILEQMEIGLF